MYHMKIEKNAVESITQHTGVNLSSNNLPNENFLPANECYKLQLN